MQINRDSLLQYLVSQGLINPGMAQHVAEKAQQDCLSLPVYLAQNNILNNKVLAQAIAQHFNLPWFDLSNFDIHTLDADLITEKLIKKHFILPLFKKDQQLHVAMADPSQTQSLDELKFHTGSNIQPLIVEYDKLKRTIEAILSRKQYHAIKQFKEIPSSNNQDDAPIIIFVQQILADAINQAASDIHFEPYETYYRIRLRIDGILHEITNPPVELATRIAARLKVMAKLDISERRLPQDGRFTINLETISRECRISTCPTLFGEKIVVRILDAASVSLNINDLGLETEQNQQFINSLKRPQGMILVTGPTGSGKTLSLYAGLNLLNTLDKNISTVEDPIEINLPGINQVNINPKAGLSFSTALRAFLRQDPDIIMVGEIRDSETAEIAIRAAQTGHLVLSTVHTNSAPETLTRLINMGVAPFNIASSVSLIIAQRLVRCLCPHCKQPQQIPTHALIEQGFKDAEISDLKIFTASSCEHCTKGYKGRTGIFEILVITETIGQMLMNAMTLLDITNYAKTIGMQTLRESALNKIKLGITSLEEINRVTNIHLE